jgi:hypothetical protein
MCTWEKKQSKMCIYILRLKVIIPGKILQDTKKQQNLKNKTDIKHRGKAIKPENGHEKFKFAVRRVREACLKTKIN